MSIVKVEDEKIHMSHVALVRQQDIDGNVAVKNLRISREKSGNHLLANPPNQIYILTTAHRVPIFTRDETELVCLPTQLERILQLYW
jgi:hypothetical protein